MPKCPVCKKRLENQRGLRALALDKKRMRIEFYKTARGRQAAIWGTAKNRADTHRRGEIRGDWTYTKQENPGARQRVRLGHFEEEEGRKKLGGGPEEKSERNHRRGKKAKEKSCVFTERPRYVAGGPRNLLTGGAAQGAKKKSSGGKAPVKNSAQGKKRRPGRREERKSQQSAPKERQKNNEPAKKKRGDGRPQKALDTHVLSIRNKGTKRLAVNSL